MLSSLCRAQLGCVHFKTYESKQNIHVALAVAVGSESSKAFSCLGFLS